MPKNKHPVKVTTYKNTWRKKDIKYRNARRHANYAWSKVLKTANRRPTGIPHRQWTEYEDSMLNLPDLFTDSTLAMFLDRSVQAIQQRRYLLKKESA